MDVGSSSSANNSLVNDSTNLYAKLFEASGVPNTFVVLIVIRWLVALLGMVLNASIILVTRSADSLHGTCNILIAVNAASIVVLSPFTTVGVLTTLVPTFPDFIALRTCFWVQLVPMISGHMFSFSMLAIAVDRMFGTFFSLWHSRQANEQLYLAWVLCICFGGTALLFWYNMQGIQLDSTEQMLCLDAGELYKGSQGSTMFYIKLGIMLLCILCYLIIWQSVRKNKAKWNGTFTQKILKSLLGMVWLITIGYVLSLTMRIVSPLFDSVQFVYALYVTSIISQCVLAANAPMLYIFSQDYRGAYRKHFPRLFHWHTVQVSAVNHNNWAVTRVAAHAQLSPHTHTAAQPAAEALPRSLQSLPRLE